MMRKILVFILMSLCMASIAQVGDTLKKQVDSLQKTTGSIKNDSLKVFNTTNKIDSIKTDSTKTTSTNLIKNFIADTVSHTDSIKITDTFAEVMDSITIQKTDSLYTKPLVNKYGDLLNDDPLYNPKYPWWKPAGRILFADITNWAIDRYIFNYDWARISPSTWKYNIQKGWEWDND